MRHLHQTRNLMESIEKCEQLSNIIMQASIKRVGLHQVLFEDLRNAVKAILERVKLRISLRLGIRPGLDE